MEVDKILKRKSKEKSLKRNWSSSSDDGKKCKRKKHSKDYSSVGNGKDERLKRKTKKKKKKLKIMNTLSESETSSSSSESETKLRKKKKHKEKKLKKKKSKIKERKELKQTEISNIEKNNTTEGKEEYCSDISAPMPTTFVEKPKRRVIAPMTQDEYNKQQSKVRRVFDPETGRERLVKGDGEIIEEVVSYDRHKAINKMSTMGDGAAFQKSLGLNRYTDKIYKG